MGDMTHKNLSTLLTDGRT